MPPQYESAMTFNDCLARVGRHDSHFFIRPDGALAIHREASGFSEGRAWFEENRKFGFIDSTGVAVIPPRFDEVYFFHEGRAPVKLNELWGFIDKDGRVVVEPQYTKVDRFSHGLAGVCREGLCGYIDTSGKVVIPLAYGSASSCGPELCAVEVDDNWGLIDRKGAWVWKPGQTPTGDGLTSP